MLCGTCRHSGRVGFVRASANAPAGGRIGEQAGLIPCPDCGGSGIAHCCDGICEQPNAPSDRAPDAAP